MKPSFSPLHPKSLLFAHPFAGHRRLQAAKSRLGDCLAKLVAAFALGCAGSAVAASAVWVVELEGAIGPASSDYFMRTLERADEAGVDLLVLRLDTPGGLDKSMRDMVKAILASPVPVATYVAPNGSRAASAGTYIMYASHIAAMAPATNIGSSTPVSIGGGDGSPFPIPSMPSSEDEDEDDATEDDSAGEDETQEAPPPAGSAMERKVLNDSVAYIKGLAELRGRNAEWAEATVLEAANLTATEALAANVIDLIADDLDALLADVNGLTVNAGGIDVTIDTNEPAIETIEPDWRYELLGIITDPNVAYILLMIGIYGLILEFYNPGVGIGAVVGVICLLLGAFALQMLPINYAGLALIVVGIGLLAAEAFSPSFGIFGVGGVIAFVIGSIILMDTDLPAYQLSVPIIAAVAALSVGIVVFALGAALRSRRLRDASGKESMVGGRGRVVDDFFEGEGRVQAFGEVWQASDQAEDDETDLRPQTELADAGLKKGARVTITGMDGLRLIVARQQSRTEQRENRS